MSVIFSVAVGKRNDAKLKEINLGQNWNIHYNFCSTRHKNID